MKLSAVAAAISLAAARLGIAASVQVASIAATAEASRMKLLYALGHWITRLYKEDSATALDVMVRSFFKSLVDNAATADAITREFIKGLNETPKTTDTKIIEFFKTIGDSFASVDAAALGVEKPLGDSASTADAIAHAFTKDLIDTGSFSDVEVYAFLKVLLDSASTVDAIAVALEKPFSDGLSLADSVTLLNAKQLYDQVNSTDDIDGAASIADDQTMEFIKGITDVGALSDLISIQATFNRVFADQSSDGFNAVDQISKNVGLAEVDSAQVSDGGSIRSQGYSDFTYFSADYVGVYLTF
jgi:hypothetical protein